ncbi:hypothetical protein AB9E21_06775 [Rhizobium leguminosarum]
MMRTRRRARTSNDEITLDKAVGTALADLAGATMVYEALAG